MEIRKKKKPHNNIKLKACIFGIYEKLHYNFLSQCKKYVLFWYNNRAWMALQFAL